MTIRLKGSTRDQVLSRPAIRSPIEAAEAARQRRDDPAHRVEAERRRGRGAVSNPTGRHEPAQREGFVDGWDLEEELPPLPRPAGRNPPPRSVPPPPHRPPPPGHRPAAPTG